MLRLGVHVLAPAVFLAVVSLSACGTLRPGQPGEALHSTARPSRDGSPESADSTGPGPHFYQELEYGSQSTFGPASVFLNRGFDVFQFSGISRHLADFPFRRGARDVVRSIATPGEQVRKVGLGRFITTELLPLNFTTKDARWYPNYTLHLVGGGITYRTLREWFESRQVRAPGAWSAFVVLSSGFLNEVTENRGLYGLTADHVADLYVFDIAGVLLFSSDRVSRFFSDKLQAADWSPVPSITTAGNLQNAGQFTVIRLPVPGTKRIRLFFRMGMGGLLGLSFNTSGTDALTVAGGTSTKEMILLDESRGEIGITSRPTVGVFYDRNNSLLASLVVMPGVKEPVAVSVYPGVLPVIGRDAGLWIVLDPDWNPTVGISLRHTFGLGFGIGR